MPSAVRPGAFNSGEIEAASASNPPFSRISNWGIDWWYSRSWVTTRSSSRPSTSKRRAVSGLLDKGLSHFDALLGGHREIGFGVFDGPDSVLVAFETDEYPFNVVEFDRCLSESLYAIPTMGSC